jgi:hypothetical protein
MNENAVQLSYGMNSNISNLCDFRHREHEVCVPGSERRNITNQSGRL